MSLSYRHYTRDGKRETVEQSTTRPRLTRAASQKKRDEFRERRAYAKDDESGLESSSMADGDPRGKGVITLR